MGIRFSCNVPATRGVCGLWSAVTVTVSTNVATGSDTLEDGRSESFFFGYQPPLLATAGAASTSLASAGATPRTATDSVVTPLNGSSGRKPRKIRAASAGVSDEVPLSRARSLCVVVTRRPLCWCVALVARRSSESCETE
jgi:hypothetical protein